MNTALAKLTIASLLCLTLLSLGCATQNAGITWPISIGGQQILVNSAPVLTMQAEQSCNAQAQV